MLLYNKQFICQNCKNEITEKISNYSSLHFGYPLCKPCQDWLKDIAETTSATNESISLYFALRLRNVPAQLEKTDGFKTIDIAVPHAKVNIEVDGGHHIYNAKQAMSDLKRTLHSYKKGYSTLRIPNSLAKHDLEQAADLITEYLIVSRENKTGGKKSNFENSEGDDFKRDIKSKTEIKGLTNKESSFVYQTSPNYSTDQNFFFPALSDLLKTYFNPKQIHFDKDCLTINALNKYGIDISISGRLDIDFDDSNAYELFKEKHQVKINEKLNFYRVYWNRDVINIYFKKNFEPKHFGTDLKDICDNYFSAIKLITDLVQK